MGVNGDNPDGALIVDASGNLFGATLSGGAQDFGTVFEITHSGFVTQQSPVKATPADVHATHASTLVPAFIQAMAATTVHGGPAGLFNDRVNQDSQRPMLATPRLAIA